MDKGQLFPQIRKLRKKLRQIETLQNAQRPLTSDEQIKIQRKRELRQALQDKLQQYNKIAATEDLKSDNQFERDHAVEGDSLSQEEISPRLVEHPNPKESEDRTVFVPSPPKKDSSSLADIPSQIYKTTKYNSAVNNSNLENDATGLEMKKPAKGSRNHDKTIVHEGGGDRRNNGEEPFGKVKKKSKAETEGLPREVNPWDKLKFSVVDLTGHNDIICSVDCYKDIVISGSRDTTIKVWDAISGAEIRNLGGHTDSVTAVELVPIEECLRIASVYNIQGETGFILSSSLDCSIKLWALESGHLVKSIYTFNAIISMGYVGGRHLTATGYTGGKIELWDILNGDSVFSTIGHEESVTALKVSEDKITTASADGMIKVWELRGSSLHPIFVSENVRPKLPRMKLIARKVHTVAEKKNKIYYGDNGLNVKVLDWREGVAHKIRNHKEDNAFGFVDSIQVTSPSSYLICSGYDLDLGNGYLNVFSLEKEKYLATLMDHDVSRIFTMATSTADEGRTRLVTGGAELKVWDAIPDNYRNKDKVVRAFYNEAYSRKVIDSEEESDDESSTDEEAEDERQPRSSVDDAEPPEGATSGSWCSII